MDTTMTTQSATQTQRRRRGGRPRMPEIERRTAQVTVALNQLECERIAMKCDEAGMDVPSYLRAAALGNNVLTVPAVNREKYTELARLAGNLNQLMRHVQSGTGGIIHGDQLLPALDKLRGEVQALRQDLLGA
ncbi:MAG: mobilization protein [Alphaproteobacteria bacterium]